MESNARELNSAAQLRAYVDLLLKQVCEDMQNQTDRTNEAFARRIAEQRHVKNCLENKHNDTMNHIHEVQQNLQILDKEICDKTRAQQLCLTRLGKRLRFGGIPAHRF